jgi:Flp pilus assembly protein TadB
MPFKAPLYKGMDSTDLYGVEGISKEERDAVRSVLLNLAYDEDVKKQKSEKAVRAAIQAAKDTAQIFAESSTSLRRKKALKELEALDALKPEDFSYQQPTKPPIAYASVGLTPPYTLVALSAVTAKAAFVIAAAVVRVAELTT